MSGIQKRLDTLQPYVVGIRYTGGISIVDVILKPGWTIPKSEYISYEMGNSNTDNSTDYMFFTNKEGIGVDELLDYVESVTLINIEREEKYTLLKEKVEELKKLFNATPLTKLKKLKFVLPSEMAFDTIGSDLTLENSDIETPKEVIETPKEVNETIRGEKEISHEPAKIVQQNNPTQQNGPIHHNNIELPPRGTKIELETHDLPPELTEGPCNCGPDEYCPKCMDEKGL